ncbi:hypothetical protein YPPY101_4520, partial [Yersinia pestis PY-101]
MPPLALADHSAAKSPDVHG